MSMTLSPPLAAGGPKISEHHWTVDEFYQADNDGLLDSDKRWELLQGRIIEKMIPGPRHAALSDIIAQSLRDKMQPTFIVREEKSVRLAFDSELIPDITVARGARTDYLGHHPTAQEVVLLVEVADSSVVKDLGEKAEAYARARMMEYWVVLVNEDVLVVHRQPTPGGYQNVLRLAGTDTLSADALPEMTWTVSELLGRTGAQ